MKKSVKIVLSIFSVIVCTLVIMSLTLSGTMAKYVTSAGDFAESARVARWGITIDAGSDLVDPYTNENGVKVIDSYSSTTDKLIAPGTKGALVYFEMQGKAEVSYAVDVSDVTLTIGDGYEKLLDEQDETLEYFPIIIKVCKVDMKNSGATVVNSYGMTNSGATKEFATVEALVNALNNDLATAFDEARINPGTDVHKIYSVEWEWAYSADANSYQTRAYDTILGETLVDNKNDFNISLAAKITAYQIR